MLTSRNTLLTLSKFKVMENTLIRDVMQHSTVLNTNYTPGLKDT